jgi:hypothetical protein
MPVATSGKRLELFSVHGPAIRQFIHGDAPDRVLTPPSVSHPSVGSIEPFGSVVSGKNPQHCLGESRSGQAGRAPPQSASDRHLGSSGPGRRISEQLARNFHRVACFSGPDDEHCRLESRKLGSCLQPCSRSSIERGNDPGGAEMARG